MSVIAILSCLHDVLHVQASSVRAFDLDLNQGATFGLLAGMFMTTWINIGQLIYYPHRSHLDTNTANCTHLGNTTARPILEDKQVFNSHSFVFMTYSYIFFRCSMDIFGLYQISYMYIGFVGFMTTMIISILVSVLTGLFTTT